MDHFNYQDGRLYAEDVSLEDLAQTYGTPCYVYSKATLTRHWQVFDQAFGDQPHLICYAVKANANLAILDLFARMGSGFDVVSIGELERVLAAGGDPNKIVFSGVGKLDHEIRRALEIGIHCFNVESMAELGRLNHIAHEMECVAPISLRINPDIDPQTHPYISTGLKENKFGIEFANAKALYLQARGMSHIKVKGIDCHIGSQLTELRPFLTAMDRLLKLVDELVEHNIHLEHIDLGGGLGVRYQDEEPPHPSEHAKAIIDRLKDYSLQVILEPGRAIAANAGLLMTRVEYLKHTPYKHFAIVDAAMNDLIRPALYGAWQAIIPVVPHEDGLAGEYDIVGPVCETGDFLGKKRHLNLLEHDLLAIRGAGAYSFVMSSNYNSRPKPPEIMVDGDQSYLIRPRESVMDLFAHEKMLPTSNE
ncbi:MAG: diaminopimelate decarboxylase [Legionellales bacterium]|nr:diaminopimelate decarboxylase [Legionellales bacterium]